MGMKMEKKGHRRVSNRKKTILTLFFPKWKICSTSVLFFLCFCLFLFLFLFFVTLFQIQMWFVLLAMTNFRQVGDYAKPFPEHSIIYGDELLSRSLSQSLNWRRQKKKKEEEEEEEEERRRRKMLFLFLLSRLTRNIW